ncbi:MAG: calcium-binding protein [Rhodospirillaceae bacterium]
MYNVLTGVNVSYDIFTANNFVDVHLGSFNALESALSNAVPNPQVVNMRDINPALASASHKLVFMSVSAATYYGSDLIDAVIALDNDTAGPAGVGNQILVELGGGNDVYIGGSENDNVDLGDGDDEAYGNDGNDLIKGGAGNDLIGSGLGQNTIDGGADTDILYLEGLRSSYTFTQSGNTYFATSSLNAQYIDTITNIEFVTFELNGSVETVAIGDLVPQPDPEPEAETQVDRAETVLQQNNLNTANAEKVLKFYDITDTSFAITGAPSGRESGQFSLLKQPDGSWGLFDGVNFAESTTSENQLQFGDYVYYLDDNTLRNNGFDPGQLRDFDGNDLGSGGDWQLAGIADVDGDGTQQYLLINTVLEPCSI